MDNIQAMEAQMLAESMMEIGPINDVLEIDAESRTINVPANELIFGVITDQDVERKYFRCPRIVGDNIDLSSLSLRVHFENANGEKDKYIIEDLKVDGNYVTFSWRLSKKVLMYNGTVNFAICAVHTKDDGTLVNRWNTTLASGNVLNGLEVDDLTEDEETEARDVLQQLLNLLNIQTEETIQSVKAEGELQINKVESEGTAQIESIANEGLRVLNTIPEDYTSISEQVEMLSRLTGPVIRQEVEGESITVKDSAKMSLLGLQMYGKSSQRTTTGVNILPNEAVTSESLGVKFTVLDDGGIQVEGTATGTIYLTLSGGYASEECPIPDWLIPGETYTINDASIYLYKADGGQYTYTDMSFVMPNDCNYYGVFIRVGSGVTVSQTNYPIINKGDTALPWEPYTGGQASPNPEYPQEIVSVENPKVHMSGKNLFDISQALNDNFVENNGVYTLTRNEGGQRFSEEVSLYIPANTPFKISIAINDSTNSSARLPLYFRAVSGKTYYASLSKEYSCMYGETVVSCGLYLATSEEVGSYISFRDMQIEIGETATKFETFKGLQLLSDSCNLPGIPVSSGGNYIDENGQQWISDEIDFERGVRIQRIDRYVVTGEEAWYLSNLQNFKDEGYYRYDANTTGTNGALMTNSLCTHFPYTAPNNKGAWVLDQEAYLSLRFIVPYSSVGDLKTFLIDQYNSGIPVEFHYVLWNPIETPIPEEELQAYRALHTNYPNTIIVNDSGAHMKLTYATDTKTYIDNKFAELLKP